MTGASDAADRLLAAAATGGPPVRRGIDAYRAAMLALREATELIGVMHAIYDLILAGEALEKSANALKGDLRLALAEQMADTGCSALRFPHHTVSVREQPAAVVVIDQTAIPLGYWTKPERRPDLVRIGKTLRAGRSIPGVQLGNGGRPTLVISKADHKEQVA